MSHVDAILARAKRIDRLMAGVITLGGLTIIAAVLGMLLFIAKEASPLFMPPQVQGLQGQVLAPAQALLVDESGKTFLALDAARGVRAHTVGNSEPTAVLSAGPALPWRLLTAPTAQGEFAVLGADGALGLGQAGWDKPAGEQDPKAWTPKVEWKASLPSGTPLTALHAARWVEGRGLEATGTLIVLAQSPAGLVLGRGETGNTVAWTPVSVPEGAEATSATLSQDGTKLYVGTEAGAIHLLDADTGAALSRAELGQPVTALGFVLGGNTLLVGGRNGALLALQALQNEGTYRLQPFHRFAALTGPVRGFMMSMRDKRFLAWSDRQVVVDYLTTEKRLLGVPAPSVLHAALSSRGDHIHILGTSGQMQRWHLDAPHPQTTWKTLWGRVHYEGYEKPEHVWQSTGGTDDFEPKLSLVPLLFGTLKGTLYAMLFALPLAVFGALYTSQFATPRLRNAIKPTVEIMAALPSVVLGFLAGLVLAPLFERGAIHILLLPVCALLVGLVAAPFWVKTPTAFRNLWGQGREVLWVIPVILAGLALSQGVAPWFERVFLGGDFRQWLMAEHGLVYDQRNALVVGFAMGFAVIPIIFTISEDALSSVPKSLTSASLACGASPWQTAWRVVLPTASPGIFSATMVGFGRAIGETMIVLMATGNTPILDWGPFNGMRTMSATIAVEAPEAPHGGTLFRVLFLTALLLFVLTFLLNTLAELIRQHLRKRYETF